MSAAFLGFPSESTELALCGLERCSNTHASSFVSPAQRDSLSLSLVPVGQDAGFLSADVGDNVTLPCFYGDGRATIFSWYKQVMGEKLQLMSHFYLYAQESFFFGEFRNSTRFQLATENLQHRLIISDVRLSDSATYYCMRSNFLEFEFDDGTAVSVKGSGLNLPASIRRSASGTNHSGDSAVLNCSVHAGICDGEPAVCSFRTSGGPQPGLIFTTGGRNTKNKKSQTCFYDLSVPNQSGSQTGTDHCAVAACGHLLFGDRAKPQFEGELFPDSMNLNVSVTLACVFTL